MARTVGNRDDLHTMTARLLERKHVQPELRPCAPVEAGVLVPLFEDSEGEVHAVLTERSARLKHHGGEVALPGGKRDAEDCSIEDTALREAHEEMALAPSDATLLATFPPLLSLHCLSVTPVVASISAACAARLTPSPDEVAAVFTVPLRHFLERHERHTWQEATYGAFTCRIHHFAHGRWDVWGLTASILIQVAEAALGRPPEFDVHGPHVNYAHLYSADGREVCLRARRSARLEGAAAAP